MKLRTLIALLLLIGLCFCFGCKSSTSTEDAAQEGQEMQAASVEEPTLTVLNPLGTPPPIKLTPMAPRLDTIKGKTIYIVNDGYPGSGILLGELTAVLKDKPGGMGREDEALWKEMEEKADAMIIALGH